VTFAHLRPCPSAGTPRRNHRLGRRRAHCLRVAAARGPDRGRGLRTDVCASGGWSWVVMAPGPARGDAHGARLGELHQHRRIIREWRHDDAGVGVRRRHACACRALDRALAGHVRRWFGAQPRPAGTWAAVSRSVSSACTLPGRSPSRASARSRFDAELGAELRCRLIGEEGGVGADQLRGCDDAALVLLLDRRVGLRLCVQRPTRPRRREPRWRPG